MESERERQVEIDIVLEREREKERKEEDLRKTGRTCSSDLSAYLQPDGKAWMKIHIMFNGSHNSFLIASTRDSMSSFDSTPAFDGLGTCSLFSFPNN